jgi:hypothetical protein
LKIKTLYKYQSTFKVEYIFLIGLPLRLSSILLFGYQLLCTSVWVLLTLVNWWYCILWTSCLTFLSYPLFGYQLLCTSVWVLFYFHRIGGYNSFNRLTLRFSCNLLLGLPITLHKCLSFALNLIKVRRYSHFLGLSIVYRYFYLFSMF